MITSTVFALALSFSPAYQPPPMAVVDEYSTQDGHRVRWASVTYYLPDGQLAEVVLAADDTAAGDGYIFVDGEMIAHSSYDDANGVDSWISSAPGTDALAAAALAGAADELLHTFAEGPHEFPCSAWGKKVLRAGKYIWGAMVMGSAAACCVETAMLGCAVCGAGGWALTEAGSEALEGYCD
jgi:hypothetical protein